MVFLKGKRYSTTRESGWVGWLGGFGGCFFFLANKSSLKRNIFYCIINQKKHAGLKKGKEKNQTILLISNSESKHKKLILAYELYDKKHFDDKKINN